MPSYLIKSVDRKKISVFWVTGLKIFGREGTYIINYFFFWKNMFLCFLKTFHLSKCIKFAFQNIHLVILFPENLSKV